MSDDLDFDMEVVKNDNASSSSAAEVEREEDAESQTGVSQYADASSSDGRWSSGSEKPRKTRSEVSLAGSLRHHAESPVPGWNVVRLGDVLELEYGDNLPEREREDGSVPVYGSNGKVDTHSKSAVSAPGLVLGRKGSIGEILLSESPFWPIDTTYYVTREETSLNLRYLQNLLQGLQLESLNAASAIPGLNRNDVYNLRVIVPPLPEQRKIASVLYAVDQAIQKTEAIIEQAQRVKRGLLEELMLRGTDGSGSMRPSPEEKPEAYVDKRRQRIPSDWKLTSLQDLCTDDVTYGIVQAGPHVEGGVPYVKTGDMTDGHLTVEDLSRTSSEIAEKYSRSRVEAGELIITIRATVGVVKQVPGELHGANLTQGTARIAPGPEVDNGFLLWAIRSNKVQSQIRARLKGTTFDEITLGQLRQILIPHPDDTDEQKRIADRMSSLEAEIDKERSSVDALGRLKKGLMQDLLTGEVRTADKAIDVLDEVVEHG